MPRRILFIIQDQNLPSSRVRVLNLLPELRQQGIRAETVEYPKKNLEKIRMLRRCRQYDMVYLQKKLPSPLETIILRNRSKKLIFDFDDAIYYRDDSNESLDSKTRLIKFKHIVKKADLIVAGNRILADYASQFNKNITIIPSTVETRGIPTKKYEGSDETMVIGWVGGGGNLYHLKELTSVFQMLAKEFKIQVRIISSAKMDIPSVDVHFIPWKLETQEKEIALFDIGVMPLPDNKFSAGKCGYKALQYMASAVPPVVSDVGVNKDIVGNGREGFVAPAMADFYHLLKLMIKNKEMRMKMGYSARQKVEKYFSVSVAGKMLADVLRNG